MIVYTFDLDMVPGGNRAILHLSQYDEDFTLKARLFARTGVFTVESGTTAEIRGLKSDSNGFSASCTMSEENGVPIVTVAGDKQITAAAGKATLRSSCSGTTGS